MASKRFLMVPDDSSAASRPLPGVTMAKATLLRSARFIGTSSGMCAVLAVKIDRSRAKEEFDVRRRGDLGRARWFGSPRPACGERPRLPWRPFLNENAEAKLRLWPKRRVRGTLRESVRRCICGQPPTPTLSPQAGRGEDGAFH